MKKISIVLSVIMTIFLCGCISFQVGSDEKELAAKIAARHVGFELQKEYPNIAKEVLGLSKEILLAEKDDVLLITVNRVISVLTDVVIDDPLLTMDIQDLVSLIQVKVDVEITQEQKALINAISKGLVSGIEIGKK